MPVRMIGKICLIMAWSFRSLVNRRGIKNARQMLLKKGFLQNSQSKAVMVLLCLISVHSSLERIGLHETNNDRGNRRSTHV
jgi:hypothetical protein